MCEGRRIAVAADDVLGLDGQVSGHFGRCIAYVVVETQDTEIVDAQVIPNPHSPQHVPGGAPEFIHQLGAHAVVAGGMGPRAFDLLSRLRIEVATGVSGRIRDAVNAYLRGEVRAVAACAREHPPGCGGRGRHA